MKINRTDISIHIHGNIWSDFANLFTPFFEGPICDAIEETVDSVLNTGIPAIGNGIMERLDGYFPIPLISNWIVDWETPQAAIVTDTQFAIGVKGLMFDREIGEEDPGVIVPDMPYYNTSRSEQY